MAITFWSPNAQKIAQVATLQVTAVANGGTLSAIINGKSIVYTCNNTDTTTTAATTWAALLQATQGAGPPEFAEVNWTNPSATNIVGTAAVPGTPFTLTKAQAGGATCTLTATTANSSPSDVGIAANWNRAGSAAIPVNGDDVVVSDSTVPLLWNLTALAAVQFASFTRWQSFTGTIGLPTYNPLGYVEYRPTYFEFIGSGTLTITLGIGSGNGPSRERYNCLTQHVALTVLAAGSPVDAFSILLLNVNASSTVSVLGASIGVAVQSGEVSTIASAALDGGGSLVLGSGVTIAGGVIATSGNLELYCAPGAVTVKSGVQLFIGSVGLTYASIVANTNCTITWVSNSTITGLAMANQCTLNASGNLSPFTITDATIDGTCQILDPNSTITYTDAVSVTGIVSSGPFQFAGSRTVKIT
jgi:hypothetical protein